MWKLDFNGNGTCASKMIIIDSNRKQQKKCLFRLYLSVSVGIVVKLETRNLFFFTHNYYSQNQFSIFSPTHTLYPPINNRTHTFRNDNRQLSVVVVVINLSCVCAMNLETEKFGKKNSNQKQNKISCIDNENK